MPSVSKRPFKRSWRPSQTHLLWTWYPKRRPNPSSRCRRVVHLQVEPDRPPRSGVIDKSVLALPEPRRVRDRDHVKSVAKRPCLICGRRPSDAHHLRCMQRQALGRKVSDEFTVPLCRGHHRELHRCGDEAAWWRNAGIDPTTAARALWLETHPLPIGQSNGPTDAGEAPAGDPMDRITRG